MTYAIVVVIVLILDQAVKFWTNSTLAVGETAKFIPKLIELTNYQNTGMAWGLLDDKPWARWLFVVMTLLFCVVIIYMLASNVIKGKLGRWMILLVMAGGLGNCIDRIVKGYVVDSFHFQFWNSFPVFNVADIFISVGGIIFCLWLFFHKSEEPEKVPARAAPRGARANPAEPRRDTPAARQGDYITQLKKPVSAARVELEQERARAEDIAREQAKLRAAREYQRQYTQPRSTPESSDPFADFKRSEPASRQPRRFEAEDPAPQVREPEPRRYEAERPSPQVREPEPRRYEAERPVPQEAPPPKKKNDMDFTLEDILAEFSDQ